MCPGMGMLEATWVLCAPVSVAVSGDQGCPGTLFGVFGHSCPVAPSCGAFPAHRAESGATVHPPGGITTAPGASWALAAQCRLASGMQLKRPPQRTMAIAAFVRQERWRGRWRTCALQRSSS